MFESLPEKFHEKLPDELNDKLDEYLGTLSVEKLGHVLEGLHEFMLLKVAVKENTDDEDYVDSVNNR